jgi:multisubunit Na+/H+ antiporter MnhC subunit
MVIAMSLLIVALTIISHTVYKYFLTIGEVQEKLNTLIGKLEK